jgi:hypothetical protein
MRKRLPPVLGLSFLVWGGSLTATDPCLHYETENVELVGIMRRHVFPGPPNFESVEGGDAPEKCWVLHLPQPICVVSAAPDTQQINEPESGISQLQLNQVDYKASHRLLGKRVKVQGHLVHAITGHHHTKVMLEVLSIVPEI